MSYINRRYYCISHILNNTLKVSYYWREMIELHMSP